MDLTAKQFEILLCEFCQKDLPADFTVEHDTKEIGSESENKRQIDAKIRGKLGISDILICGEAKNWSKKVGIEEIDAVVGKYFSGEILANKVILFSNLGYTKSAINRAKKRGIELLEPRQIDTPIESMPYIVAVGYLGPMDIRISHQGSPQQNLFGTNIEDYTIIIGHESISFQQFVKRLVVPYLRTYNKVDSILELDIPRISLTRHNVLYELKQKKGFRYNANFDIVVSLKWDYFYENLPTGILRHINTEEIKLVNLQGSVNDITRAVLLSEKKINIENKEELVQNVFEKNIACSFHLCIADPDRNITDPENPKFDIIY